MNSPESDFRKEVEEAVRRNIDRIGIPSQGHADENGKLRPENTTHEIREKYGITVKRAREMNNEQLARKAEEALRRLYPDHTGLIDELRDNRPH